MPSERMMKLVGRLEKHSWNLPKTVPAAIGAAILGHGLWNGTSWGVSKLLADVDTLFSVFLQLAWLGIMVSTLWLFILRWLPSIVLNSQDGPF